VQIKDVEDENEKLRNKLDKAGFDIFCKIKKEIQKERIPITESNLGGKSALLDELTREIGEFE